jgi:hypothetical protein
VFDKNKIYAICRLLWYAAIICVKLCRTLQQNPWWLGLFIYVYHCTMCWYTRDLICYVQVLFVLNPWLLGLFVYVYHCTMGWYTRDLICDSRDLFILNPWWLGLLYMFIIARCVGILEIWSVMYKFYLLWIHDD